MTTMNAHTATKVLVNTLQTSGKSREEIAAALGRPVEVVSKWLDDGEDVDAITLAEVLEACDQSDEEIGVAVCALLGVAA